MLVFAQPVTFIKLLRMFGLLGMHIKLRKTLIIFLVRCALSYQHYRAIEVLRYLKKSLTLVSSYMC